MEATASTGPPLDAPRPRQMRHQRPFSTSSGTEARVGRSRSRFSRLSFKIFHLFHGSTVAWGFCHLQRRIRGVFQTRRTRQYSHWGQLMPVFCILGISLVRIPACIKASIPPPHQLHRRQLDSLQNTNSNYLVNLRRVDNLRHTCGLIDPR